MNDEIQSKITVNMKDEEFNQVKLKYKDILLNLYIVNLKGDDGYILIDELMRGHFILENPKFRTPTAPIPDDPPSGKGDGALFLSLMVIHCNSIFGRVPYWKGRLSEWWGIKGVCSIKNACTLQEDGVTVILNDYFLDWAKDIVTQNQGDAFSVALSRRSVGYKKYKRKLNKKSNKRKSNKRKSNKRKSNKRKSNKRKSNKRKSNKNIKNLY